MHCILGVFIAFNTISPSTVEVSASTRAVPNHGRGLPPGSLYDSQPAEHGTHNTLKGSDVTFPGRNTRKRCPPRQRVTHTHTPLACQLIVTVVEKARGDT
jgi:hypothetical protein